MTYDVKLVYMVYDYISNTLHALELFKELLEIPNL